MRAGSFFEPAAGRPLRPRHVQPAVRDLARVRVPLPRQRPRGRQRLAARGRRRAGAPRGGRVRQHARELGARAGRGLVGAAARLGRRQRLRRVAPPPRHGRAARARGELEPRPRRRRPGGVSATCSTAGSRYFERLGIEGIAYGAVILRRRSGGPNWVRTDELAGDRLRPGERAHPPRLRRGRLPGRARRRAGSARRDVRARRARPPRAARRPARRRVDARRRHARRSRRAWASSASLDPATAELLASLDGRRPLRAVVDEPRDASRRSTATRSPGTRSASSAGCSAPASSSAAPRSGLAQATGSALT